LSTFGEIKSVRPGIRPDGTSKGYAHIEFTELSAAAKVLEAHKQEPFFIGGRSVRLDYAPPPNRVATQPYHKLYIYDFPKDEASLRMAFKDFDETIMSVSLMKDAAGKSTGAGFVEFGSIPQATDALEALNDREIEYGVKLNLSYARPRKPRDSGGRGYGWDSQEGRNSGGYDGGRGGGRGGYSRGGGRGGYSGRGERERGGGYRDDGGY
jgi:nucleolin